MAKTRWSRDEYILLLDLYKRLGKQPAYPQTLPEVVALSRALRRMNQPLCKPMQTSQPGRGVLLSGQNDGA